MSKRTAILNILCIVAAAGNILIASGYVYTLICKFFNRYGNIVFVVLAAIWVVLSLTVAVELLQDRFKLIGERKGKKRDIKRNKMKKI